jgi:hypothetical protein
MAGDRELIDEVLGLKKAAEEAKLRKATLEGRIHERMEVLQRDFNCSTVAEAEKKADELEKEAAAKEAAVREEVARIREEFRL